VANYDASVNLLLNAQKAFKELADFEQRLKALSGSRTKVQKAVLTETSQEVSKTKKEVKDQVKAAERKLEKQLRLNAALERQETLLKNLTRAGAKGERKERVEELVQVSQKFPKKLGIQNSVNAALEKELQTLREINRTDRAQNATNSKILTSIRKRFEALRAVGATTAELNKVEKTRGKLIEQNSEKQTDLAKETFSKLDRQLKVLERKYSTFLNKPGRQIASPLSAAPARTVLDTPQALKQKAQYYERIAKSIKPLSSPLRPQSVLGSDEALRQKAAYYERISKSIKPLSSPLRPQSVLGSDSALRKKAEYYERIRKSIKPLSSPLRPQSVLGSDEALRKKAEYYERINKAAKTTAGPRSPIRGSETIPGSPKFLEAQAKKLNRQENLVNKTLNDQRKLRAKNAKEAKRTADQVARKAKQELQAARKAQGAGIVGAGFPLLFGGGPGSIIGGALGGALGGKELGFELSIGLSAVGSVIDRLVGSARNLGDAFSSVDDTLNQVKQIGFSVDSATEKRVQLLLEEGRATEAFLLVLERTGIRAEQVNNLRQLDSAFDELQDATAKLFVTILSELAPAIIVVANLITSFVNTITGSEIQRAAANLDPQAFQAAQIQAATETASVGEAFESRQAYEKRLTELSRGIVNANTPDIDTSTLENIKTLNKENLDLLNKRIAVTRAGNDLTNEAAYIAARQLIFSQTRLEAAEAQGNREKISLAVARERLALDDLRIQRQKAQLELQRKITDAQISAKLAQDVFLAQPVPDPTPFSRQTPIEKRDVALELESLRYAAETAKIRNQGLKPLERQAKLEEESAKNNLNNFNINKEFIETEKKLEENRILLNEELELQIQKSNTINGLQRDLLDVEANILRLEREGVLVTNDQIKAYRKLAIAAAEARNPGKIKQRIKELRAELADTQGMIVSLSTSVETAMGSAISTAVTSLVTGAQTIEETLSDLFKTIGEAFVKMAAEIIAKQLVMIALQTILKALGAAGGGGKGLDVDSIEQYSNRGLATGGPTSPGTTYMVGEKGPELLTMTPGGGYVTSNSSSRAAMGRYNTSNTADSTPTFRLETTVINGVEYATVDQVREMGAISAKRGAQMGQSNTMKSLQNSRSQRSRIGMR